MYEMTLKELLDTLESRRKGLAYKVWKNAYLISWAVMGKQYPKLPEGASPELYPKKPRIKMPDNLFNAEMKKRGGNINYE